MRVIRIGEEPQCESDNSKKRWSRPKRDFDLLIDI